MTPSELIDKQIADTNDWRGEKMSELRKLIHTADPDVIEEWKWDVGVYTHNGMVCAVGSFKDHIKINFFKGAQISDPNKIFNNGLESKKQRSIDIYENDKIDKEGIKNLIQEAVKQNNKP